MIDISFRALTACNLCPRKCNVNRFFKANGYCRCSHEYNIDAIVKHLGEEPVVSGKQGICNVFFNHCNLQCVFCQNYQISNNKSEKTSRYNNIESVIFEIEKCLESGCHAIGFVSPSHQIPHMLSVIKVFENYRPKPVFVYNTNAYDNVETLKSLERMIDVYLPDFKYLDEKISARYSDAPNYPEVAKNALKEMFRQKGAVLHLSEEDLALSGIIIRHLVLPAHIENSKQVLRFIAEELSPKLHISLMSQYYPSYKSGEHPEINRALSEDEYIEVVTEMENLGLTMGWIQQLESNKHYRPDFDQSNPF